MEGSFMSCRLQTSDTNLSYSSHFWWYGRCSLFKLGMQSLERPARRWRNEKILYHFILLAIWLGDWPDGVVDGKDSALTSINLVLLVRLRFCMPLLNRNMFSRNVVPTFQPSKRYLPGKPIIESRLQRRFCWPVVSICSRVTTREKHYCP